MPASLRATPRVAQSSHTITELVAEFDITPRAIRLYEDVGLLTPQRVGRNRVYTQARCRTLLAKTVAIAARSQPRNAPRRAAP